jgi:pimeloyl-ACP methyl ester carboxylesterase
MTRIIFLHGLEGGPSGAKSIYLRERSEVLTAPDLHMSVMDFWKTNSIIRSAVWIGITRPWTLFDRPRLIHAAVLESLLSCTKIAEAAISQSQHDIIIGSSWGGAVCLSVISRGKWGGNVVLLAPALKRILLRSEAPHAYEVLHKYYQDIRNALKENPGLKIIVVHGSEDKTVPLEDSEELCRELCVELIIINGGDHGMNDHLLENHMLANILSKMDMNDCL